MTKKEPKWLYRIESLSPDNGLWYNNDGNYCFGIEGVKNCPSYDFPMGYDERYRADGRMWYSSCTNVEDIKHWFTYENARELVDNRGFVFKAYLATEYTEYPNETVFIKDTSLDSYIIDDLEKFYGVNKG